MSKGKSDAPSDRVEDDDENTVYLEDLDPSIPVGKPRSNAKPQSSTKPRFYDHDPYNLPDMDFDSKITEASRSALDPRLATAEEMESFISEMAPSNFDLTSEVFRSLPTEVQYEVIGDLRLKSRQTSFKRLQNMLKNSDTPMDFSKEQIKGLKERNRLTQQLLTTTDSIGKAHVEIPIRIAGERNREYVLVKNEGEGKGWILGMRDVGTRDQPIIVDDPAREGVKPKEARDDERGETGSDNGAAEEAQTSVSIIPCKVQELIHVFPRPTKGPFSTTTAMPGQDLPSYRSRMSLSAAGKRQKPFNRSSPAKSRSGIFPRRPSALGSRAKTTEVPLFVPDEEDVIVPQVVSESEGDEWEDFDGGLEEAQMSIAIAESLESGHQSRRTSDPWASARTPILKSHDESFRQTNMEDSRNPAANDEDEFTSPSRLATQLSIAGARKPLSTLIPSDPVGGAATFSAGTSSVSLKKPTQNLTQKEVLDPSSTSDIGDKEESDEDDDMEEVTIPQVVGDHPLMPPEPLVSPDSGTTADPVETPLAIGVEDVIAKRFAEFQKTFAEKRSTFRAENLEVPEEIRQTREVSRAYSPGLEYADEEVGITEVKGRGAIEVKTSPPLLSDEDDDMEEVEVVVAPPPAPHRVSTTESLLSRHIQENADEHEDVPISDWSRSPSPRSRPPAGESGPSTSVLTLDRSRGLLDPDESFEQVPPGERDQEHEDFDAAHEMDPDAEAGEFARWMSQVKGRNLDDVRKEIEQEINVLRKEQKAAMRDSEDITNQMIAQIMVSLVIYHAVFAYCSENGFGFASVDDVKVIWDTLHHRSDGS